MYKYEDLKPQLFTDEGQRLFLKIRDQVNKLLSASGAVSMGKAISGVCGDSWELLACVDRLVELDEIREITSKNCITQDRVFVRR